MGRVAQYLTLVSEDPPQLDSPLRDVFNAHRWIIRTSAQWRWLLHDLPPWYVVCQQSRRRIKTGAFEALVHDLSEVLRLADGRNDDANECCKLTSLQLITASRA